MFYHTVIILKKIRKKGKNKGWVLRKTITILQTAFPTWDPLSDYAPVGTGKYWAPDSAGKHRGCSLRGQSPHNHYYQSVAERPSCLCALAFAAPSVLPFTPFSSPQPSPFTQETSPHLSVLILGQFICESLPVNATQVDYPISTCAISVACTSFSYSSCT